MEFDFKEEADMEWKKFVAVGAVVWGNRRV